MRIGRKEKCIPIGDWFKELKTRLDTFLLQSAVKNITAILKEFAVG